MFFISSKKLFSFSRYSNSWVIHNFFPSQDIKQNALLSSYLDTWWPHKFQALKQWLIEKKKEDGNSKTWISWEQKELLDEIKNIFNNF